MEFEIDSSSQRLDFSRFFSINKPRLYAIDVPAAGRWLRLSYDSSVWLQEPAPAGILQAFWCRLESELPLGSQQQIVRWLQDYMYRLQDYMYRLQDYMYSMTRMLTFALLGSALLASASFGQNRQTRQIRTPNGQLIGTISCWRDRCEARDSSSRYLGSYSSLTRETRDARSRLVARHNALEALVWEN